MSEQKTELARRNEFDETDVFWLRDGLISCLQGFATTEEAMQAARRFE